MLIAPETFMVECLGKQGWTAATLSKLKAAPNSSTRNGVAPCSSKKASLRRKPRRAQGETASAQTLKTPPPIGGYMRSILRMPATQRPGAPPVTIPSR